MSWQLAILRAVLRQAVLPILRRERDATRLRDWFERSVRFHPGAGARPDLVPDLFEHQGLHVPAGWTAPASAGAPVLLYFHGGAYVMGSPRTHAAFGHELTRLTGHVTCLPDYRLAPEHTGTSAFDDALCVWQALRERGVSAGSIALGGDSAGGGLALALLAHLCAIGAPRPACVFTFSPFTDFTFSGASVRANASSDLFLPAERVADLQTLVLGGADPRDPRHSPLFGQFPSAPPVLLQVARTEILRDDSRRMAGVLRAQGAEVSLQEWGDLPHGWQLFHAFLPEAQTAIADAAAFITAHLPAPPSADN